MRTTNPMFACLAVIATTLAACSGTTSPDRELQAARSRWASARPAAYTITLARSCECTPEMTGPVIVSVRDGVVESRTCAASGAAVAPTSADLFPSVDGLFALIDDARQRRAASLDVAYDPALGFPLTISIDYDRVMVDDEVTYRATSFQPR